MLNWSKLNILEMSHPSSAAVFDDYLVCVTKLLCNIRALRVIRSTFISFRIITISLLSLDIVRIVVYDI